MLGIGNILFDPSSRRVFRGQEEFKLSPKAASVLMALAETPGQVWSRDALLERVWPTVHVGEEVLTHAIAELRRAFGDDFRNPRYLATVHKSGYRLLAQVRHEVQDGFAPQAATGRAWGLSAFAAYLEAVETRDRGGRENALAAAAMFSTILQEQPEFALAHVGQAKTLAFLGSAYEPSKATLESALLHCGTALRLSPTLADAAAWRGYVLAILDDFERSLQSFKVAIELRPDLAETHLMLGRIALARGEMSAACVMYENAARHSPNDHFAALTAGVLRKSFGEAERARRDFGLSLQRIETREAVGPVDVHMLRNKARCLLELGRPAEGFALLETVATDSNNNHFSLACHFAAFGETRRALESLERGAEGSLRPWSWLSTHPDLAMLRGDQRFGRLTR